MITMKNTMTSIVCPMEKFHKKEVSGIPFVVHHMSKLIARIAVAELVIQRSSSF